MDKRSWIYYSIIVLITIIAIFFEREETGTILMLGVLELLLMYILINYKIKKHQSKVRKR